MNWRQFAMDLETPNPASVDTIFARQLRLYARVIRHTLRAVDEVLEAYRPWIEFDEPDTKQPGGQTWARLTGRRIEG